MVQKCSTVRQTCYSRLTEKSVISVEKYFLYSVHIELCIFKMMELLEINGNNGITKDENKNPVDQSIPTTSTNPFVNNINIVLTRRHTKETVSAEYREDLFQFWRRLEAKNLIDPNFMSKQHFVNFEDRNEVVDLISQIAFGYKFEPEVLFLAVQYMDRFLSHFSITTGKLELVGLVALHIAAKFEWAPYIASISNLLQLASNSSSNQEFLRMEQLMLKLLRFDLAYPTPLTFLNLLETYELDSNNPGHDRNFKYATYMCQLFLLDPKHLKFTPSQIACASISVAQYVFADPMWEMYIPVTQVQVAEFYEIVVWMYGNQMKVRDMPYKAIPFIYSQPENLKVALLEHKIKNTRG